MLGGGVELERLKQDTSQRQLKNMVFLRAVTMDVVGVFLQAADALLVHLPKAPLFEITIPSTIQAYMAVGKPLLMAVNGDAVDLVRQSRSGAIAESEKLLLLAAAEELAKTSPDDLKLMGQQAKTFYQYKLALSVGKKSFTENFM